MLWVPHVNCTSYGDGIASGVLGKDQLKLGVSHPDQLAVPSISFGLATTIETNYSKVDSDGMLGLAYANVVGAVNEPFILDVLNKSGLSHLFTVWLDPEPVEYLNSGGTITYGSVDDLNCGPVIQFENITTVGTYQYHIDSISMGNYTYNVTSTVTQDLEAFIVAPAVFVKEIAKIANARYDKGINLYSINCTARFPDLKIKSGSVVYEVTDRNLIINLGFNQCLLAMVPADGVMSTFSFGIPFNRQYCTIFDIDERRIGFAVALPDQRTTRSYGCKRRSKFHPDQSTTFVDLNKTWETISYGDGIASGVLGKDQLKLGVSHPDQLALPNISFGLATMIETNYSNVDSDGMLGLAYANVVGAVNEPFILDVLNKGGLRHLFTVWLDPEPVEYLNSGGTITYGSVDDLNCGPVIQFENITTVGTYQYRIDSISMGNYTYNVTSTVTQDLEAFIVAPAVFVKEIAKIANARYDKGMNLYSINCTARFPDLKIKSGSVVYEITDRNLIINLGFNQCLLAMVPADGVMSTFSFGIPFNRQYCTIFDTGERRIGFAVALPDQRTTRRRTSSTKSTSETRSTATTGSTVTTAPKSAARLIMTFALIEVIILLPLKPSICSV
ncbi:hypothetical protein OESDEN_06093 [Oesophagostomum dentatum]|uniref:Peptidase A1 domain-containing protein n=1 Tax=Oesophagostomum dentatum TaxID=61180 RepID=A0A0B1T9R3_OESDE|nr:hypothetical protein OESDEN_06093 [Oesophagostomum dentatum]